MRRTTLGRSTAAVSMKLKQFEAHLDGPLFEADRKTKLTALGSFVLDHALRELDHFDRSVSAIEAFARSETGFVSIAAVPSVAERILAPVIRDFEREHPGVHLDIRDMDSAAILRELDGGRVDLGLASGAGATSGIHRDVLFSDAFGVVCRSDHPLAGADLPLSWDALEPWPFIANGLCGQITDADFQRLYRKSRLTVQNTTSLKALVRGDVGVTVLPRLVVGDDDRDMTFLPVADAAAVRTVEILRSAQNSPPPPVKVLEQAIYRTVAELGLA